MEHLCKVVCGSTVGVGEAYDVLRHVRQSIYAFGSKTDDLLKSQAGDDLTLIGPYCARVLMETGCAAVVGRLDPFRILYLSRFQAHSNYDPTKRSKSAFSWQGDVLNPDRDRDENFGDNVEVQKISRALFSSNNDHIHWRPAVSAALDYAASMRADAAIASILLTDADRFVSECKGKGNMLYSQLSKGVHWEFFSRISVTFDEQTVRQLMQDAIMWVSKIALISHFIPTAQCRLTASEAFQSYLDVWEWINA